MNTLSNLFDLCIFNSKSGYFALVYDHKIIKNWENESAEELVFLTTSKYQSIGIIDKEVFYSFGENYKTRNKMFVAINYITCKAEYKERFEELFATRAKAIDRMPGFRYLHVLKQNKGDGDYLIVSHWDAEENFAKWTTSPEFIKGHQRGFQDLKEAKTMGEEPPMKSDFKTYTLIAE